MRFQVFQALLMVTAITTLRCNAQTLTDRIPTRVIYESPTSHSSIPNSSVQRGYDYNRVIYLDDTPDPDVLVVGAKNNVLTYSLTDVSTAQSSFELPLREPSGGLVCRSVVIVAERDFKCHNYASVIRKYDYNTDGDDEWYYCGTSGIEPHCWICAAQVCTGAEANVTGIGSAFMAESFISVDPSLDYQPFLFTSGKVFSGGQRNNDPVIISSTVDTASGQFSETGANTAFTNVEVSGDWVNDPEYVSDPIEYTNGDGETHIYYFFREEAREYSSAGKKIYSRVARVCVNDNSGSSGTKLADYFTTFLKARLNCSIPGADTDYPVIYNYLQDVYQSASDPKIIYALFTDNPVSGRPNSAICVYQMDEIAAVFKYAKFRGHANEQSLWLPPSEAVPIPRPGTCSTHNNTDYDFINMYTLMDFGVRSRQVYPAAVPSGSSFNLSPYYDSEPPIMLLDGLYLTEMAVDENVCGETVFYLGSFQGKVYKAYVHGLNTATPETRIVDEIDLTTGGSGDHKVLTMFFHSNTLYVGTISSLHEIPVPHCSVYTSREQCILAQDPYCSWDGSACTSSCSGTKCLAVDPRSCDSNIWPAPEILDPYQNDRTRTYNRIQQATTSTEDTIQIQQYVQSDPGSVWGKTTFSCSCGCPPVDMKETVALSNVDATAKDIMLGIYYFDMSTCTSDVTVTFTFTVNGRTIQNEVTVKYDSGALITDNAELTIINDLDEKLCGYYYQTKWWKKNQMTSRNAQSAYCYDCASGP